MLRRCFLPLLVLALLPSGRGAEAPNTANAANAATRPATAEEQTVLNTLLHKIAEDFKRWAYTEHRVIRDGKGKVKSEQIVRHDPSKPYAEQWVPIKLEGKEPTERDLAKFRRRGEQSDPANPSAARKKQPPSLGEAIDVSKAFIAAETATHWVFEIPLLKFGNERFPPEKFQVLARVKKDGQLLENISLLLRESFRAKLVVKVKSGDASLDFVQVNPKFPPTLVKIEGDAAWSILFVGGGGAMELTRTELKHVKPFDERFDVQIGTLKAIDF